MANLASIVTGNFSAASTWSLIDSTSYLNSETSTAVVPTSAGATARSSAFTPGAITISGIAVKLANRTGTTGTLTVELWNNTLGSVVAATTVTINTADLPAAITANADGGWIVFGFASVLLLVANDYMVQCTTSSASQISLFTDATTNNWSRMLRTTTTQAPTTGDDLVVSGELTGAGTSNSFTVTMDSTAATDYGSASTSTVSPSLAVCNKGTLTYGSAAATNYILRQSGHLIVYQVGVFNIGTTGTPIPRNSTALLEFDCAADADFGFIGRNGSTINIQGLSRTSAKNVVSCKLNTDATGSPGSTVLGVDTDTGWLSGDVIIIAGTSRTASDSEQRTLSVNASATQLTITVALVKPHLGTSPMQAEVINLTRNVKLQSVSSSPVAVTFFYAGQTAIVDVDWAEFVNMGEGLVVQRRGVVAETTTGSFNMQFCSLHDFEDYGFYINGTAANNITFSNNVGWQLSVVSGEAGTVANATTGSAIVINGNVFIGSGAEYTFCIGWSLSDIGITFTNNTVACYNYFGFAIAEPEATFGTFSGQTSHSNHVGYDISGNGMKGSFTNDSLWRNRSRGTTIGRMVELVIDGASIIGNVSGVELGGDNLALYIVFRNCLISGDAEFETANGFTLHPYIGGAVVCDNCDINTVTVGIDLCSTNLPIHMIFRDCVFSATFEVNCQVNLGAVGFVSSQRHNQVSGNHKTWLAYGTLATDTTIFNTASPSMRMTPRSSSLKLESAAMFQGIKAAVNNGSFVNISVYTRKSDGSPDAYNGSQPRLILKANPAIGIDADVVIATHTAAAGTWEQLIGTTSTASDDGVMEFVVDCDGTNGWVNVDDWSVA